MLSDKIVQISNLEKSIKAGNQSANSMVYYPNTQKLVKSLNNISEPCLKEITSLFKSYPICELLDTDFLLFLLKNSNMIRSTYVGSSAL